MSNADKQAARVLRVLNETLAEGTSSAGALARVMEELADYAQAFPVLTHGPVRIENYAVTAARLGAIAAELRGLAREQSPPPAPTNEQAGSLASWLSQQATEASGEAAGKLLWASQLISGLIDEDAPEGAPVHRAPAPIPIPPEGIPESAKSDGRCWLGFWVSALNCWEWIFCSCDTAVEITSEGSTHYLPADIPSLPSNTFPAP